MSTATEKDVATALLGSWPSQVASWGKAGIAAYLSELGARGVTPAQALCAIRACPADQKFPPSAPELAGLARDSDRESTPTFAECYQLIYGKGGIMRARPSTSTWATPGARDAAYDQAALERAKGMHPLVASFAERQGIRRLRLLAVEHPDHGELVRKDLEASWKQHVSAMAGRDLAQIAAGIGRGREGLTRFDPLAALGLERPELGPGIIDTKEHAA